MNIKDFIEQQLEKGLTLNRLGNVLGVSQPTIKAHYTGESNGVRLQLAKKIYKKFDVVIEGFIEIELKED